MLPRLCVVWGLIAVVVHAETGASAWLRYAEMCMHSMPQRKLRLLRTGGINSKLVLNPRSDGTSENRCPTFEPMSLTPGWLPFLPGLLASST